MGVKKGKNRKYNTNNYKKNYRHENYKNTIDDSDGISVYGKCKYMAYV